MVVTPAINTPTPRPIPVPAPAPATTTNNESSGTPVTNALAGKNAQSPLGNTIQTASSSDATPTSVVNANSNSGVAANAPEGNSGSTNSSGTTTSGGSESSGTGTSGGTTSGSGNSGNTRGSESTARPVPVTRAGEGNTTGGNANTGGTTSGTAPALVVNRESTTLSVDSAGLLNFTIPKDTFISSNNQTLVLKAAIPGERGDQPLPSWLRFDPVSGTFSGEPPADAPAVLRIRVTAKDSNGNEASAIIIINRAGKVDGDGKPAAKPQAMLGKDLLQLLVAKRAAPLWAALPDGTEQEALQVEAAQAEEAEQAAVAINLAGQDMAANDATGDAKVAQGLSQQILSAKQRMQQDGNAIMRHLGSLQQNRAVNAKQA